MSVERCDSERRIEPVFRGWLLSKWAFCLCCSVVDVTIHVYVCVRVCVSISQCL